MRGFRLSEFNVSSVAIYPGLILFTRTPLFANSTAIDFVSWITPALEAQAALTDKGYRVTVRLPYDALPGYERSKVRFNAYCLDMRPDGKQLLYALNPTLCKSFHRPKYFL